MPVYHVAHRLMFHFVTGRRTRGYSKEIWRGLVGCFGREEQIRWSGYQESLLRASIDNLWRRIVDNRVLQKLASRLLAGGRYFDPEESPATGL